MTSILKVDTLQDASGSGTPYIKDAVLQVKQNVIDGTDTNTASTDWQTSPVTGSITPSKSTSKILVRARTSLYNHAGYSTYGTIYRGSTYIGSSSNFGLVRCYSTSAVWQPVTIEWLDEPNTTSAVTYTVYFKVNGGTGYISHSQGISTVTMMEIGG